MTHEYSKEGPEHCGVRSGRIACSYPNLQQLPRADIYNPIEGFNRNQMKAMMFSHLYGMNPTSIAHLINTSNPMPPRLLPVSPDKRVLKTYKKIMKGWRLPKPGMRKMRKLQRAIKKATKRMEAVLNKPIIFSYDR